MEFKMCHRKLIVLMILICLAATSSHAQEWPEIKLKEPYLIDVNKADKSQVFEIKDNVMGILYLDGGSSSGEISMKIYTWDNKLTGNFLLDKNPGQNQYTIDLNEINLSLNTKEIYTCRLINGLGNEYTWYIKGVIPKKKVIDADIRVNTVKLTCNQDFGNLMEFYGVIKGAVAPYSISWFVMDTGRNSFLFQPKNDIVEKSGKVSMIEVDKKPGYYVVMDVTDACGNNTKKMVYVSCQETKKKINSIFAEPIIINNRNANGSR